MTKTIHPSRIFGLGLWLMSISANGLWGHDRASLAWMFGVTAGVALPLMWGWKSHG